MGPGPSFAKPIEHANVAELRDALLGMVCTEVRSNYGDRHHGHVFGHGPSGKGGLRYCINSASYGSFRGRIWERQIKGVYVSQVKEVG